MRAKKISFVFIAFVLSACSFNKMFLRPTKMQPGARELRLKSGTDSVLIRFEGENQQPLFLKNHQDTIQHDFIIESVNFKSSSGNVLNGWMIKPKNQTASTTLLHLHGNAGFLLSQYRAITPLVPLGFQVFIFDYSGFGFSEGRATRNNVMKDAHSALDYVKTRSDVKNTKLVIYGQSLGGHLSAVVAAQRQDEVDALVIEGAFSSHKDIGANRAGFLARIFISEKYSAYRFIRQYKKPVLVIHSTDDRVIPFEQGKKIFENAAGPKSFYEIKQCHICGPVYYADSIAVKIMQMLK